MREIDLNGGVADALESLLNNRLALLAGAGLSMAPPSNLPSAAAIAADAKQKYDATYGATRDPLPAAIEEQAEFFFQRNELSTVYFRRLVDIHAFAGPPNPGHFAIADLLLVQGIRTAVTTNVDGLIEDAGHCLYGQIGTGLDQAQMASLPPDTSPLLKIHGCLQKDPDNMVWARGQLARPPVADRITSCANWLVNRLLDRDLLIVGYWSDWDYLNEVLERSLDRVRPSRILVIDPDEPTAFAEKASSLYALGESVENGFLHVRASGADFLDALRLMFSQAFVRRVLRAGMFEYQEIAGVAATPGIAEPPRLDNESLWQMRRDLEGCVPNQPASMHTPPPECTVGLTILQLRARGATPDGHYWNLDGRKIRVLRASNQLLHRVESKYARETAPVIAPDVVIAVGAEAQQLPSDFVRAGTQSTITRGTSSRWLTRPMATEELGL